MQDGCNERKQKLTKIRKILLDGKRINTLGKRNENKP